EIRDVRNRQRLLPEHLVELLPLDQPLRQQEAPAAQAEREFDEEVLILELAAESEILSRRPVVEGILPIDGGHDLLDLARREAARIQPADHGAHARAGDGMNGNVKLLENLEHSDVRGTSGAAAGKHETDPWMRSARLRHISPCPKAALGARKACGGPPQESGYAAQHPGSKPDHP